jgi:hypothetical protein
MSFHLFILQSVFLSFGFSVFFPFICVQINIEVMHGFTLYVFMSLSFCLSILYLIIIVFKYLCSVLYLALGQAPEGSVEDHREKNGRILALNRALDGGTCPD